MPRRDWRARITDLVEAAERAIGYADGLTFEAFSGDPRTVDAVSFAIVVIGEAARHVPEDIAAAVELPWAELRGMRNKVAHEYFGVDVRVLWDTVREDLPPLVPRLRALLGRTDLP